MQFDANVEFIEKFQINLPVERERTEKTIAHSTVIQDEKPHNTYSFMLL
jgi:hypothetical protein